MCALHHTLIRWNVARMGEVKIHMIFWFKNLKERNNLLWRPRSRRKHNIKMSLKETDCNRVDSSDAGYGRQ
jgi:hypothetical protein